MTDDYLRAYYLRPEVHPVEESGMELLYAPYIPNKAEYLILTNRRILSDQMEFLKQHVAAHSRLVLAPA